MRWHVLLLKERYQFLDHFNRDDKSSCKEAAPDEDFIELKHFVSSVQRSTEEFETQEGISLIMIRNRREPRILPRQGHRQFSI